MIGRTCCGLTARNCLLALRHYRLPSGRGSLPAPTLPSDGVEQLTRYLELLNRDPLLSLVRGVFAAQEIKPQARVLAGDRGIECLTVDYAVLKGTDDPSQRLF